MLAQKPILNQRSSTVNTEKSFSMQINNSLYNFTGLYRSLKVMSFFQTHTAFIHFHSRGIPAICYNIKQDTPESIKCQHNFICSLRWFTNTDISAITIKKKDFLPKYMILDYMFKMHFIVLNNFCNKKVFLLALW